jgi:hypothetical protein
VNLTRRERLIGIVAVAAFAALVADNWVITPLYKRYQDAMDNAALKQQEVLKAQQLVRHRQSMQAEWRRRQDAGLINVASEAEGALLNSLEEWSGQCGLNVTSIRPERQHPEDGFEVVRCRALLTGRMEGFAGLCWRLGKATIPLRVEKIQLSSADATRDTLGIQLDVSTVCLAASKSAGEER